MHFHILSLFPDMFHGFLNDSVLKRGQEKGAITITTEDFREYSTDKHKKVDDIIYGGGAGMLLKPEPVAAAIRSAKEKLPNARVVYMSPSGEPFSQRKAEEIASSGEDLILLCGRYEGLDQRVRETLIDEEISIGDYVLSGGEIAAATVVDVVARLVPGVVGKQESVQVESFSRELFRSAEFPQFTRPEVWEDMPVPEVLRSGDHKKIEQWQMSHLSGLSETERRVLKVRYKSFPRKTRNILFRLCEEQDIDYWMEWVNDEEVTKMLSIVTPPLTREDEEEFFESSRENLMMLPVSLCDKKTKKPIGTMGLTIDMLNEYSADLGIMIGDKNYWGKGVCQEAISELVQVGFKDLDLKRIHLKVFAENIPAQKCYEKCGFQKIGVARKNLVKRGEFKDEILYEILKEE